ncbi:MAG: KaiC domain-containing protein [Halobacteria archaeon]
MSEQKENQVKRVPVGVDGLDEMIAGGVPKKSTLCVLGNAGTGKTTLGMQFVKEALQEGEKAVFFTLEEFPGSVLQTADMKGWNFTKHYDDGDLAVVHMDPIEVSMTIRNITDELPRMIKKFGASRVVIDSVTLIEKMFEDNAEGRTKIHRFMKRLNQAGTTTMVTSEASSMDAYTSKFGNIEYLADGVFSLRYVRTENTNETRLALEVLKIRNTEHSRNVRPYDLTDSGIKVHSTASIF